MVSIDSEVDYYPILEVPRGASVEFVTQSYRRLAKICHPDREGGSTAAFQLVSTIYTFNVLSRVFKLTCSLEAAECVRNPQRPREKTTVRFHVKLQQA